MMSERGDVSEPAAWRRRWKENALLCSLLVHPSKSRAHRVYELVSTENLVTERSLYLNLGYWKDAPATLDDACDAMAVLLADEAGLSTEDRVLDVGFGFGDQDLFWMDRYAPRHITGLNVTPMQVDAGRKRVAERGLTDRIDLRHGSATKVPLDAGSIDKVLALECAFHFHTRDQFFAEAFRVLRPGGRLALTDIVPLPRDGTMGIKGRLTEYVGRAFWQICTENMYDRVEYVDHLARVGFQNVKVISLHDEVMEPFARFTLRRMSEPDVIARLNPSLRAMFIGTAKTTLEKPPGVARFDYVLAVADKPAR
jgi:cyclopropane fatty-acyl-phospholipid synthase-like methyltransferase